MVKGLGSGIRQTWLPLGSCAYQLHDLENNKGAYFPGSCLED